MLALALMAMNAITPEFADHTAQLDLDPCLKVDEAAVRTLVELQLGDARMPTPRLPITAVVRCVEDGEEIRVEPWASRSRGGVRTLQLPSADDGTPAAQEARSRELALTIAELIRRLEITQPLAPEPASPPPAPPAAVVARPASAPEAAEPRWQLGVVSAFERWDGGLDLAGGDVWLGARLGHWAAVELRAGGRVGNEATLPWVRVITWAATVGAAAGLQHWWRHHRIGAALMARGQGYLVQVQAEPPAGRTATGGATAVVLAAEPRLMLALSEHLALVAAGAAGAAVHDIEFRVSGTTIERLSGLTISANLGAVLTF